MTHRIIRWPTLRKKLGGEDSPSSVTIWRWERDGFFPKRVKLGPNASGWLEAEIDQWIEQRASER